MKTPEEKRMLDYLEAVKLRLFLNSKIEINLIGCGGTGGYVAPHIARVVRILKGQSRVETIVRFVDGDTVEPQNIYRQNFCEAEIGRNKAVALATRYNAAWGLDIMAVPEHFTNKESWDSLTGYRYNDDRLVIFIGCVDNASGRKAIHDAVTNARNSGGYGRSDGNYWWIDSGNGRDSGQVLVGCNGDGENAFAVKPFCARLPLPSLQMPDLLVDQPIEENAPANGCVSWALAAQGLTINNQMAAVIADYLTRMLITNDLAWFQTEVNQRVGSTHTYITKANVNRYYKSKKNEEA